ncbi:MAG: hypothetical protein WA872_17660 [Candidatus Sulfotelmatobacter sp.]
MYGIPGGYRTSCGDATVILDGDANLVMAFYVEPSMLPNLDSAT